MNRPEERSREPMELTQDIRELLESAGARIDPFLYHMVMERTECGSTVIDGWKDAPETVQVTIRFSVDIKRAKP